jgi:hypothetical protein
MMVPHHQGAVAIANQLLKDGEQPALRKMAQDIIDAQTKEIAQMREWRKAWYGSVRSPADPMADHDMHSGGRDRPWRRLKSTRQHSAQG